MTEENKIQELLKPRVRDAITQKFHSSTFVYYNDIPMDGEIADFIYKLNKCQHIITTNSCAGHDKFESGAQYDFVSHPYLSFIVDEIGWDIFWQCVLPEVAENLLIHVDIANEPGKISINVRAHFDDKTRFWHAVKPSFLNHFPADYHAYIEKQPTTQNQGV